MNASPKQGYPTYIFQNKNGLIKVRFLNPNLCYVREEYGNRKSEGFSAVDYHNKLCVFRVPSGSTLTLNIDGDDSEWEYVPEESKFNGIINLPYMITHYPSSD